MLKCRSCGSPLTDEYSCSSCGGEIECIRGIRAFAPELIDSSEGFESEYFADLYELEAGNFWFKARNQLIISILRKHCVGFESFLEIGCGTGFVLNGVSDAFPVAKTVGSEIFVEGLDFASQRCPGATLIQMDARDIPYFQEFDVVGAFDVLEHIEEDEDVISQVKSALKPDGHFIITVPQHQWLWSQTDEYARHVRRYSRAEIHTKLKNAGFEIIRSSSFVTSLLPAMWLSRIRSPAGKEDFDPLAEFNIPPLLNKVLWWILKAEAKLVAMGASLPVGGSLLVLARRTDG